MLQYEAFSYLKKKLNNELTQLQYIYIINSFIKMPLVLMCGIPGSGKTFRALQLKKAIQQKYQKNVILINQENLQIKKQISYSNAHQQKITRAKIKFQTQKNLINDNIVIVDSLNYIKGYRYQMYCISREMKTTYCVIFCNTSIQNARIFNLKNENRFDQILFDDLVKRLQVPQLKNRWDVPLIERRQDQATPIEQIIDILLFQQKKSKDPISTKSEQKMVGQDYLYQLDKILQSVCETILKQQSQKGVGYPIVFSGSSEKIILNNNWSIMSLKKIKNQFLNVIKGKPLPLLQIGNSFIIFINESDKRK